MLSLISGEADRNINYITALSLLITVSRVKKGRELSSFSADSMPRVLQENKT
jgi:hypothetical protein